RRRIDNKHIAPALVWVTGVGKRIQPFVIFSISERVIVLSIGAVRVNGRAALPVDASVIVLNNGEAFDRCELSRVCSRHTGRCLLLYCPARSLATPDSGVKAIKRG